MMTIQEELKGLKLGGAVEYRNLTVWPLLRSASQSAEPDYLLLEEAIAAGSARITEIGGGGSVPELELENRGDRPVLLLDGEELLGAKQNRVLNLTILAGPRRSTRIPVSCVEAGRWHMQRPEFESAPHFMYARARAERASQVTESIRACGGRRADQGAVWEEIAAKASRMEAASPTGAMNAIYEKHEHTVECYLRAFSWLPGQAGVVYRIGALAAGVDLLDHPDSLRKIHSKLIRSYALDALECGPEDAGAGAAFAEDLLGQVASAPSFAETAVGLGKDVRISGRGVTGAALWADARYVHLCAFTANGNGRGQTMQTRLSSPRRRSAGRHTER